MAPSLSSSLTNGLTRLAPRDLGDTVSQATGIHDWDSCMAHGYCKWPVIVGIIVVSLILLSIIFCIARCCGCCADCCRCLSCCCPGGREKTKYVQAPQQHAPPMYPPGGYGWQPHMAYGAGGGATSPAPPQFATFESASAKSPSSTTKIHADSLPAMPSWTTARSKQVEDTSEPPEEETKPLRNNDELGHGEDIAMARLNPSRNSPRPDYARGGSYNQVSQRAHTASPGVGAGAAAGMAYGGTMYNDRDYNSHEAYDGYGQQEQGYGHGDQGYGGYRSTRPQQHQQYQPNPYEYDVGNPYSAQSPQSPTSNYTNGTAGFPPPSYRTQPPSRAYTPANQVDRSAYGSQNSRYAASSDYASTVGYQGAYAQQRQQQPRSEPSYEQNYSLPDVAEMPATRASHLPAATSAQSRQNPQELGGGSEWRPQNQMPAALTPGAGDWRSAGQRGGSDRKPVAGTWREV